jgi:hypothetical protein
MKQITGASNKLSGKTKVHQLDTEVGVRDLMLPVMIESETQSQFCRDSHRNSLYGLKIKPDHQSVLSVSFICKHKIQSLSHIHVTCILGEDDNYTWRVWAFYFNGRLVSIAYPVGVKLRQRYAAYWDVNNARYQCECELFQTFIMNILKPFLPLRSLQFT